MPRHHRFAFFSPLLAFTLACGAGATDSENPPNIDPDGSVDEQQPDGGDSTPVATSCETSGDPRAAVITVNGDEDAVWVMSLDGGQLVDNNLRFTGIVTPRAVAMHPDGTEALVAWGGFGGAYGIAIFDIAPDGSSASMKDNLELGEGPTPFGLAYASADHIVLATAGSNAHNLVTIDRVGDALVAGPTSPVPNEWPLELDARPGSDEVILARANLSKDSATDVYRVTRTADMFQAGANGAALTPRTTDIAVHASGNRVFSPSRNPDDPMAPDHLDTTGLLHVVDIGDNSMLTTTFPLPHRPSQLSASPRGDFLVLSTPLFELDPVTGTPISKFLAFETVRTDSDGHPVEAYPRTESFPALLINDMAIAPSGHLVVSNAEYPGEVPDAQRNPLRVWNQKQPGTWEQCQTIFVPGSSKIAIAP